MACPGATSHPIREIGHPVEDGMNFWHDVFTVDDYRGISRSAKRNVQHCALFCDVDLLATEHGVDSRPQARFLRELKKEIKSFVGGTVLGIVEIQSYSRYCHALTTFGIIRKKLPQMQLCDHLVM